MSSGAASITPSGWEKSIASPEMFLAAVGERTKRIKLGTGVVSLPYHHPPHLSRSAWYSSTT